MAEVEEQRYGFKMVVLKDVRLPQFLVTKKNLEQWHIPEADQDSAMLLFIIKGILEQHAED